MFNVKLRSPRDQVGCMCRRFVDFHGEMLLLVHWSILAYTGMVKILKKHHKRTGLLVRAPHLDNLAAQPFCSTEVSTAPLITARQPPGCRGQSGGTFLHDANGHSLITPGRGICSVENDTS
jgi:hypothetical protein